MLRSAKQLQTEANAFAVCPRDKLAVRAWLTAAEDKIRDADNVGVSLGTRFEAAYDAAFFIALAVLNAEGWKSRSVEGHHAYVLEAACLAVAASTSTFELLDAVRDIRNQKYAGVVRVEADLHDARRVFDEFSDLAGAWFLAHHPTLLK